MADIWETNGSDYGTLALLVLQGGPYGATTRPNDFKKRIQVDNSSTVWATSASGTVPIYRAIRIPVEIKDSTMDDNGSMTATDETILIGLSVTKETAAGAAWGAGTGGLKNADKFGRQLTRVMVPKVDGTLWIAKKGASLNEMNVADEQETWEFRGLPTRVERTSQIPFVVVPAEGEEGKVAHLYVGFEGAGGY